MARRTAIVAGALALQVIALVLAHDLAFFARFGSRYGEALVHAGHGATWTAAFVSSVVFAGILGAVAAGRLLQLWMRARRQALSGGAEDVRIGGFLRAWLRPAIRMSVLTAVLLTIQENIERFSIGQGAPGPAILISPEYPFGLWIALGVGALVAFVAALFAHRHRVLLARLRPARPTSGRARAAAPPLRRDAVVPALPSILGRRSGRRAPPAATPA